MKLSYQWLKTLVDLDLDAQALAEVLTQAGLEVDSVSAAAPVLDGVVVGEILEVAPHPDADKLRVCAVAGAAQPLSIVCGAPNTRQGLKAPLATVGTVLPGGLEIKPARLRGVASAGMLCSAVELGLGEGAGGLMELPADAPVGQSLADYLALDDHVLEIDLTPNRADCLSMLGLAREVAALTGVRFDPPVIEAVVAGSERTLPVSLDTPGDCSRYAGRVIEGVDPSAATPAWMVERLRRAGLRSLGVVVDITNYVQLELGQPMHAFDLERLRGGIDVRRARGDETITLLDGKTITPGDHFLVIADVSGPVALAGVMGGLDSAVTGQSRNIFLESAWFAPAAVIGRARELGLATESAHRFERGVDPTLQALAVERATALILEIAGGVPGPVVDQVDAAHAAHSPTPVMLRPARLNGLLGCDLETGQITAMLRRLGMTVDTDGDRLHVQPPPARRDIALEVDLIEEVARLHGYDNIPVRSPGGRLRARVGGERELPERALRDVLVGHGFFQSMGWSFVSEEMLARFDMAAGAQPLANPLSREMAVLRTALTPGLVAAAGANLRRRQGRVRLFETGHCFRVTAGGLEEPWRLALLMAGAAAPEHWHDKPRAVDFYDLKGRVESLLVLTGGLSDVDFRPVELAWLHPGQAAQIHRAGRPLGWLGQLHPRVGRELDLPSAVFVAELDMTELLRRPLPEYRSTSRFPEVRRDLALLVAEETPAAALVAATREAGGAQLRDVVIFDQYQGEGIEEGYKSLAIGLIIQEVSRTLRDEEADALVAGVVAALQQNFQVQLRG